MAPVSHSTTEQNLVRKYQFNRTRLTQQVDIARDTAAVEAVHIIIASSS